MTYYLDLSAYDYIKSKAKSSVLNIGWLDKAHDFKKGAIDSALLDQILTLCKRAVNRTRGYHLCPFCDNPSFGLIIENNNDKVVLGAAEIWVTSEKGKTYAAPDLMYHYIKDHGYLPPEEFLSAVKEGKPANPESE